MSLRGLTPVYGATNAVAFAAACKLGKVAGYWRGAADCWLQLFDAVALPADAAVPKKSWYQPSAAPFEWSFDPTLMELTTGCVFCFSTTEATKTIVTGGGTNVGDFLVDIEEYETPIVGGTDSTDSANNTIAIAGEKKILRVQADATNAANDHFLLLFGKANPSNGDHPLYQVGAGVLVHGGLRDFRFGDGLLVPAGATYTFAISSTGNILTAVTHGTDPVDFTLTVK